MAFRRLLSLTIERAIWLGAIAVLLGVLLIVLAADAEGSTSAVLANIGTAILTVGLVGIVYDLLLRERLLEEVLSVVGVRESVSAFGLRRISPRDAIDLEAIVDEAVELVALPLDPLHWIEQEFALIARRARRRPIDITLLLPANESPYVQILAERLGKTEAQIQQTLDQAARGDLGSAWDSVQVDPRSTLTVKRFGGIPATGLLRTDRIVAVEVGPLIRYGQLDREGFMVLAERSKTPLDQWVDDQLRREAEAENLSTMDQRPLPPESPAEQGGTP